MQSVSPQFTAYAKSAMRPIAWKCLISFPKQYNSATTFFTIGSSVIGGTDIIKGTGNVVQEWDKYNYSDFSSRLISMGWTRENDLTSSAASSSPIIYTMADLVFDNSDDMFTLNNTQSPLYGSILPYRPIKLYVGFGSELIPVFVGVTELMPVLDSKNKTATFHCVDFLSSLANITLQTDVIYVGQRTDQVVSQLLQLGDMVPSQFNLDVGTVTIPFVYFAKDTVLIDALQNIIEAEMGTLFMDEAGVITFQNRTNWASHPLVWTFTRSNSMDVNFPNDNNIINVVEVTSNVRTLQPSQKLYQMSGATLIPAYSSVAILADFKDANGALPVIAVVEPAYAANSTSFYQTNLLANGTGAPNNSAITISGVSLFSTSYQVIFSNNGPLPTYITQLELYATPAVVTSQVYIRNSDPVSVAAYAEQLYSINNDFIQDESAANTISLIILGDYSSILSQRILTVIGLPQLQIGDRVGYLDTITNETYYVTKIDATIDMSQGYIQTVECVRRVIRPYFKVGVSTIGSTDAIGP